MQASLERLWRTDLGQRYWAQQPPADQHRLPFWRGIEAITQPASLLEIGCGNGRNLACFQRARRTGVDVDTRILPHGGVCGSAIALPFLDRSFDLVLTCGVLIHLAAEALPAAYDEVARVARQHVLLVEYEDSHDRAIPWRGQQEALWARPFALRFWSRHPTWRPVLRRHLARPDGFDDCTAVLFERSFARS